MSCRRHVGPPARWPAAPLLYGWCFPCDCPGTCVPPCEDCWLRAGPRAGGCALPDGQCSRRWAGNASARSGPVTNFVLASAHWLNVIYRGNIMCECKIDRRALGKLLYLMALDGTAERVI